MALAMLARGRVVLEIGSYLGRSTICMAQTAKRVVAVDWHRGDPCIDDFHVRKGEEAQRECTLQGFWANLERYGVDEVVVPVVTRVEWLGGILGIDWADLAFVDGNHDHGSSMRGIDLARMCLKPGGIVAVHDYNRVEVRRAVEEVLGRDEGVVTDSLWVRKV